MEARISSDGSEISAFEQYVVQVIAAAGAGILAYTMKGVPWFAKTALYGGGALAVLGLLLWVISSRVSERGDNIKLAALWAGLVLAVAGFVLK